MTAVIFGSTTGNTEAAAGLIAKAAGEADVFSISGCSAEKLNRYDTLIFGTSTWGIGDLQDDWEENLSILSDVDFSGKTVAIFGLGDQEGYPDSFVDGMTPLKAAVEEAGGTVKGAWPTEGYEFDSSTAVEGDRFIGLALDEDNQSDLTESRIKDWLADL
ncbi:MAG: flavodoxin [Spirochaetales bacterium]|nr:flavodoxin [Spirochaetales bacterium]